MLYLLLAAIIIFVAGLLLLFSPVLLGSFSAVCDRIVLSLDEMVQPVRMWVGILLAALGVWFLYIAVRYPGFASLNIVWIISLGFGLLFLFLPHWLSWLSKVSNQVLFSADEMVMGSRKIVGIVLLIISIYVFYAAYMVR